MPVHDNNSWSEGYDPTTHPGYAAYQQGRAISEPIMNARTPQEWIAAMRRKPNMTDGERALLRRVESNPNAYDVQGGYPREKPNWVERNAWWLAPTALVGSAAVPALLGGGGGGAASGAGTLASRGPTAAMIKAGSGLPSVASVPAATFGGAAPLASYGPTFAQINAAKGLPSVVQRTLGLPSYGPSADMINAGRNLPSVTANNTGFTPPVNVEGQPGSNLPPGVKQPLPSRGPTPEMVNAGMNVSSVAGMPPWLKAILNNADDTVKGTPWWQSFLKGLKDYGLPIAAAGALAIPAFKNRGPTDAENQLNEILGMAKSRVQSAEPLYQALNAMSMAQLPDYVKNRG
ncbi:MAG TPA: hypothetical protein VEA16_02440 [Vicinamibacterales bacterium]|nr:hypothetical protein [Vicinamibacterales bacterium]